MIVNISEAKANLSKLVELVMQGEEVIIAKRNKPLVKLVPHTPKLRVGFLKMEGSGKDINDAALYEEDEEINDLFYNGDIFPK